MKNTIKLPSKIVQAARMFYNPSDVRRYIAGIVLDPKGYIHSTNGNILLSAVCEECKSLDESIILRFQGGAFPPKANTVTLEFGEESGTAMFSYEHVEKQVRPGNEVVNVERVKWMETGGIKKLLAFSYEKGVKLVDYRKHVMTQAKEIKEIMLPVVFSVNPTYLQIISKAADTICGQGMNHPARLITSVNPNTDTIFFKPKPSRTEADHDVTMVVMKQRMGVDS